MNVFIFQYTLATLVGFFSLSMFFSTWNENEKHKIEFLELSRLEIMTIIGEWKSLCNSRHCERPFFFYFLFLRHHHFEWIIHASSSSSSLVSFIDFHGKLWLENKSNCGRCYENQLFEKSSTEVIHFHFDSNSQNDI